MAPNPSEESGKICDAIALHPVLRQAGAEMGPVHMGQFAYGPKTGICLTQDPDGRFRLLAFRGESSEDAARGVLYSAADVRVNGHKELNRLILEYGFPHHLAMAFGDILKDLAMLCKYLGIEYVSPDERR
jgi:hypothetical protein